MIITNQIIEQGRSSRGGWSHDQFRCLGEFEFKKGWKKELIGKDIPEEKIKCFLELKDKHLANKIENQLSLHDDFKSSRKKNSPGTSSKT